MRGDGKVGGTLEQGSFRLWHAHFVQRYPDIGSELRHLAQGRHQEMGREIVVDHQPHVRTPAMPETFCEEFEFDGIPHEMARPFKQFPSRLGELRLSPFESKDWN